MVLNSEPDGSTVALPRLATLRLGKPDIIVFDLQRPRGRQRLLDAEPDGPTPERRVGAVRCDVRSGEARQIIVDRHIDLVIGVGDAGLAVDQRGGPKRQRPIGAMFCSSSNSARGVADAPGQRGDRLRAHPARGSMLNRRSAKQVLVPSDEMASASASTPSTQRASGRLPVEADLAAGHEPGAAHAVAEDGGAERVGEVAGRDREPGIGAEVKSGPIPDRGSVRRP